MLLSIIILTLARATPHPRSLTTLVRSEVHTPMPRCLKRRNGGKFPAPAKASLIAGEVSCVDDIEEVPSGLLEDYQQHQGADYHGFTTTEVSPSEAA